MGFGSVDKSSNKVDNKKDEIVKASLSGSAFSIVSDTDKIDDSVNFMDIFNTSKNEKELCQRLSLIPTKHLPKAHEAKDALCEFMNDKFKFVFSGGKCAVVWDKYDENGDPELAFAASSTISMYLSNRKIPYQAIKEDAIIRKEMKLFEEWVEHPNSNRYEGVTFSPMQKVPDGWMNLFDGWMVKPDNSDDELCKKMLWHIENVICSGNKSDYEYMIGWMAHLIQKPWEKAGVAVVLRSDERGTGKSTMSETFLEVVLGRMTMSINNPEQLLGKFNSFMADKLLLVAEESFFAGDPKAVGILNDLITRKKVTVERKGLDIQEYRSCLRLMFITNGAWAVPASSDERRYFVLNVSASKAKNRAYFGELRDDMENGGAEQLLAYLQSYDISDFDVGDAPHTDALRDQIELSMCPESKFLMEVLQDGECGEYHIEGGIPANLIHEKYVEFYKEHQYGKPKVKVHFSRWLKKSLPNTIITGQKVKEIDLYKVPAALGRLNGYGFKSLKECQDDFISKFNLNSNAFDNQED